LLADDRANALTPPFLSPPLRKGWGKVVVPLLPTTATDETRDQRMLDGWEAEELTRASPQYARTRRLMLCAGIFRSVGRRRSKFMNGGSAPPGAIKRFSH